MAALYLIRHGQASFGQADYDLLSEKGEKQAFVLGQSWQNYPTPSYCYQGEFLRHEQTRHQFFNGLAISQPSTIFHSGFNEFDHQDILIQYQPKWHRFSVMEAHFSQYPDPHDALAREFEKAVARWMSGEHDNEYRESWPNFQMRCIQAINDVIDQHLSARATNTEHKEILVFTSGGPIAVILSHILGLECHQGMALSQQLRNTSVTKLLFNDNRVSVDFYNNYSHLIQHGEQLESYR